VLTPRHARHMAPFAYCAAHHKRADVAGKRGRAQCGSGDNTVAILSRKYTKRRKVRRREREGAGVTLAIASV